MGQSTEELNADIEGTRSNLSADLDALQDKVSPSAIVGRQKAAARDRVSSVKSKVMGSAGSAGNSVTDSVSGVAGDVKGRTRDAAGSAGDAIEGSPLAAGLVAFGAGLVLAALLPASQAETKAAHQLKAAAQEHGEPVLAEAKSAASDIGGQLKESATEKAQELKESATESAQTVKDEGASSASSVADQVKPS